MGFVKEVNEVPSVRIAHKYDGTQQNLDDLATLLGPGASALNLTRISSALYQVTFVGTNQRDTNAVTIWEVRPDGEVRAIADWPDDTVYGTFWHDA